MDPPKRTFLLLTLMTSLFIIIQATACLHAQENFTLYVPLLAAAPSPVRLIWFYKPPQAESPAFMQEHFDTFILTKSDEPTQEALRAEGVTTPFLQYLRFDAIHAPGSCTAQPWRNQVADQPGDFCAISAEHPEWFLVDQRGNRIMDHDREQRYFLMDPGHEGWRAFWLERARQSQEAIGWDGVFLDNVEGSLSKRQRGGALPAAYPTDASYQAAIEGFLAYLHDSYFAPQGRPLQANIIELKDSATWLRYLQHLDGVMEEGWAVDWSTGYLPVSRWEEQVRRMEQSQVAGKEVILVAQGGRNEIARQEFALASYLLVASEHTSFRYSHADFYHEVWLYDNYRLALGTPLGPRYRVADFWQRDFTHGSVRVSPATHTATIVVH
ncbi:MAG: hypothetical protein H0T73_13385 [Ardenticatenales bacterium]|nr:hypothetical protein [Ardenticatenales bacterium]